uniref:DDRGK domain-containing protein 1 n=1 Tax=Aegilops tauschii TaxID=37682 RepID=M8CWB7_AEGTA
MDGSGGIFAAVVCALLLQRMSQGVRRRIPMSPKAPRRKGKGKRGKTGRRSVREIISSFLKTRAIAYVIVHLTTEYGIQANEAARNSRRTNQDRYEEMRRKKDEEREAQERLLEEEAMARKAKEEEAAALEFEKWKGAFSVDAEGTTESETQDGGQGLLHNFVEYIKKQKCVPLEDLAGEFGMRTQDCINRIITLEGMDRLSGVMDDRGKFIYISIEEMQAVADYIRKHGRVSISHLANNSNEFIDLEPKPLYDEKEESHQDESAPAGVVAEP